jgi:hypothetical protein
MVDEKEGGVKDSRMTAKMLAYVPNWILNEDTLISCIFSPDVLFALFFFRQS